MLLAPVGIPGAVSFTAEDTTPRPTYYILVTQRARGRLDSHRQNGFFRGFGFCPFRERVSSRQPPVSPDGDDVASRWVACEEKKTPDG